MLVKMETDSLNSKSYYIVVFQVDVADVAVNVGSILETRTLLPVVSTSQSISRIADSSLACRLINFHESSIGAAANERKWRKTTSLTCLVK